MSKLDRFSEIKDIHNSLKRNEKEALLVYAKAFENKSYKDISELGDLLELLEGQPEINKKEMFKKLGIDKKPKLYQNSFLLRTKDLILESLTLSHNVDRPGEYSNQFRNRCLNQKRIDQARILLGRGERTIGERILQEVENRAEKYELFDQLVQAKDLLKSSYTTHRASRTINRYEKELDRFVELERQLSEARNIYSSFLFSIRRDDKNLDELRERLEKLKALETSSRSVTVGFLRAMTEVSLLLEYKDYKSAIKLMEALVGNRLYSPPLQSTQGVSHLKTQIGDCQVITGSYASAKNSFAEADSLVKNDSYESYKNRKNLILIDFYESNIKPLGEEIDKRIASTYVSRLPYASAFYYLLKAVWLLAQKKADKATDILSSEIDTIKDTSDQEQFYRYMYLFLAGFDLQKKKVRIGKKYCDQALEGLTKMSATGLSNRQKLIIRVLRQIRSAKYDVKRFYELNAANLEKLEKTEGDIKWIPLSDEIIPLQNWIRHKLDKRRKLTKV